MINVYLVTFISYPYSSSFILSCLYSIMPTKQTLTIFFSNLFIFLSINLSWLFGWLISHVDSSENSIHLRHWNFILISFHSLVLYTIQWSIPTLMSFIYRTNSMHRVCRILIVKLTTTISSLRQPWYYPHLIVDVLIVWDVLLSQWGFLSQPFWVGATFIRYLGTPMLSNIYSNHLHVFLIL